MTPRPKSVSLPPHTIRMSDASQPTCVSCGAPLTGRYCASCGEKRLDHHDDSLLHFLAHGVEAFTHADGKVFATLRTLLLCPGELTAEYLRGRRRPFMGPLQLFLVVNLVVFLVVPLLGWNTFTTPLATQVGTMPYSSIARPLVAAKLARLGQTQSEYAHRFDHAAELQAHSLLILLIPCVSVTSALLFWRYRRPAMAHVVFACHFCAFWLLATLAILACTNLAHYLLLAFDLHAPWQVFDIGTGVIMMFANAVYGFAAIRRLYAPRLVSNLLGAFALGLAALPILQFYRFVLFFVTLSTT